MVKYCPDCGAELKKDFKFCVKCGNKNIQRKSVKKGTKKIVDKKTTKSDEKARLDQLKEKIQGWKKEGYKVDELEKLTGTIGKRKISRAKIGYVLAFVFVIVFISGIYAGVINDDVIEPIAIFSSDISGEKAYFTGMSTDVDGVIVKYQWNFGDGKTSTSKNPTHQYSSSGTYTVTLTVTDDDGNKDTASKTVTIAIPNKAPIASFSANPTSGTEPLTVYFTGSGTDTDGTIISYSWDFGDGATSISKSPSHTYQNSGTYTMVFTVTDNDGDTDTYSSTINVEEKPNPPDFEVMNIQSKKINRDPCDYIELDVTVYNRGGPGRQKVWALFNNIDGSCVGDHRGEGCFFEKLKTPFLESGESVELTFTYGETCLEPDDDYTYDVWTEIINIYLDEPDFQIVFKNYKVVYQQGIVYYNLIVYNNGAAGRQSVWTMIDQTEYGGIRHEKEQTPYLESGEAQELSFTFTDILGYGGFSSDSWIE